MAAPAELYHAGVVEPALAWSFDTNPGWSTEGDWAFGQPTGEGGYSYFPWNYAYPDPASGHTGTNVHGNNLHGDTVAFGQPISLVSEAIDCTGLENVQLRFWRWLNVPTEFHSDWASVAVSNDGVTWHQVWGGVVEEAVWSQMILDLSATADRQPAVQLRWTINFDGGLYTGWNVDEVEIWGTAVAGTDGWQDLGHALAGTGGHAPLLSGSGPLTPGSANGLHLLGALAGSMSHLVAGLSMWNAAFKGGVLVPVPDVLLGGLPVDGSGASSLPFFWPTGLPAGLKLYFQYWVVDASGPSGFSASNGLRATGQ